MIQMNPPPSDKQYFDYLKTMVFKIEQMKKQNHLGILRILMNDNEECINENKNGIYINLSEVNRETIQRIQKYIDYISFQEDNLNSIETKQKNVKIALSQNYI